MVVVVAVTRPGKIISTPKFFGFPNLHHSQWIQHGFNSTPELQNDIKAVVEKDQSSFAAFDNLRLLNWRHNQKRKLNAEPEEIPPETIILKSMRFRFIHQFGKNELDPPFG